ncbi:MAG: bifunctional diaminohydroxyphosphoribosylaminopyrimidine deaminase/5-amino-6-(5-phosphoribosylamino)uracil reductase RibD [Phormidesmis priestleyi]|uniref:Riboflavin biosynthesis protein RibD n=1 Tax=Phormidesmis priestleyi TaxID=268141 RepID=A0A2W4ZAM1_9CYAN|nr:MAG: bifunctional diaminohydroxyphosphoribosylaminopyrimidine deaminase/5-amino-6-(5-phosphoribosylamino)uracil reductase RibD [Phormidesmis priestleyi]
MLMSNPAADDSIDAAMIARCCELASQAAGHTAPNPLVGSVITQGDEIVAEGYHPQAGEPHAEVFALRAAGAQAQGATLYVNLEPCNHTGRTPPCSEAVIAAGIKRVVIGMKDPNPVAGGGIEKLRAAGIAVTVGVEGDRCRRLNEAFIHRVIHHRPFGILKYAMTLDGKIATTTGHSAWVSGPASRQRVHQLRSQCDAVIVGGNTVRQDNPHLTSHSEGNRNPLRIVMSRQLNLPAAAHLWDTAIAPTLVITQSGADLTVAAALTQQGVEVLILEQLTPAAVMEVLYQRGLLSVLWECGGTLAAAAIAEGAVQKVWAFIAPKIIGGANAPTPIGDLKLEKMAQAKAITELSVTTVGTDILLQGYL